MLIFTSHTIKEAESAGLKVPDDIELAEYLCFTTMQQPKYEMGMLAVYLVMSKIENKNKKVEQIKFATKLVERKTTASPKSEELLT